MLLQKTIFAIATTLIASLAFAAPAKSGKAPKPHYDNQPFDIQSGTIDANYMGHDFFGLMQALRKEPVKDEYETTQSFQDRYLAWASSPLIGKAFVSSTFAIKLFSPDVETSYNADKNSMEIKISGCSAERCADGVYAFVHIDATTGPARKTVTRMGVPFTYTTKIIKDAGVKITCSLCVGESVSQFFDVGASEARTHAWDYYLIGKVVYPYVSMEKDTHEPRLDEPYYTNRTSLMLHMEGYQIWVYSRTKKQVIAKLDIGTPYDAASPAPDQSTPTKTPSEPISASQDQTQEPSRCTPENKKLQREGAIPWPLPCNDEQMDDPNL